MGKMDNYLKNNYRMGGYLLFACGLINLRYQWGEPDVALRSALIFIPGAAVILATMTPALFPILSRREIKAFMSILGIFIIAYAFLN